MINGGALGIQIGSLDSTNRPATNKLTEIDENQLVRNSINLANYYAYLYSNFSAGTILAREDLVQEGLLGFLQALRRYNPGARSQEMFARHRIQWAIHDAIDMQKAPSRFRECVGISDELDAGYDCQSADRYTVMQIIAAFDTLKDQQRDVMRSIYIDDLTMLETGGKLGLSESRVCQIHSAAIKILRKKYGH